MHNTARLIKSNRLCHTKWCQDHHIKRQVPCTIMPGSSDPSLTQLHNRPIIGQIYVMVRSLPLRTWVMTAGPRLLLQEIVMLQVEAFCINPAICPHLAKLLCILSSISAWRVHKGDDGEAKVVRVLHEAQRFPVAIRLRHPKVPEDVFLHVQRSISELPGPSLHCSQLPA